MMDQARRSGFGLMAAPAVAVVLVAGCGVSRREVRSAGFLEQEQVGWIRAGTQRQAVLDALGPPRTVVRRGGGQASEDAAFLLFDGRHAPLPSDVVYHYQGTRRMEQNVFVMGVGSTDADLEESHLWILVDSAAGLVRDAVFRPGGAARGQGTPRPAGEPQ